MMFRNAVKWLISGFIIVGLKANAQGVVNPGPDAAIANYDSSFTTRIYLSQKSLNTTINHGALPSFTYKPNSKIALGIGASYGWFTLNLSAALGFLQAKNDPQGESTAYDLQGHFYTPKAVVDIFASYYEGQYLSPEGRGSNKNTYYVRPDAESWQLGLAGYYVLNWRKFSYRAAYLQTAWQQKSAGSFLIGFEWRHGQLKGDSALVPGIYSLAGSGADINRYRYFNLGPGAGYTYTLVLSKHWFLSAAATVSASANWVRETSLATFRANTFSIRPNTSYKIGLGYNSDKYSIDLTWTQNSVYNKGKLGNYTTAAGNTRLHFAYRFKGGKKFRKYFDVFQHPLF